MSFFLAILCFLAAPQVKPDAIKLKGNIDDKKSSVKVVLNDCLDYKADKWEECLKERLNLLKYEISKSKSVKKGGLTQLILTLKNMKVVRNVYIRGNWPIFESEIMRRVVLRPGTSLPSGKKAQIELFDTQINRVEDYLIREGYFDSKIDIRIKKNGKSHLVDLIVALDKGPSYKLGKLTIKGNKHLSDQKIESFFRHKIFIYEKPFYKQQF
ncbi:MAG: hypothetical protein PF689_05215 [Deltaproteobacteria bacterium]|jgi:outer membrane protein assembly factor BamA|nr:hypothetical protein [Deltaproteobacteria bacterium]